MSNLRFQNGASADWRIFILWKIPRFLGMTPASLEVIVITKGVPVIQNAAKRSEESLFVERSLLASGWQPHYRKSNCIKKEAIVIDYVQSSISERSVSGLNNLYFVKDPSLRRNDTCVLGNLRSLTASNLRFQNGASADWRIFILWKIPRFLGMTPASLEVIVITKGVPVIDCV